MDRRDFLALAASVPLLTTPASAEDDPEQTQAEQANESTRESGADTIEIDIQLR